jgi:energy-coupling factor transport system ATP-binding protein
MISRSMVAVESLSHIYHLGTPLERKALDRVSLEIAPGEYLGIIGRTGSGKTTLVQHFNGLLKPFSGRVYLEGVDLSSRRISWQALRRKVGLVFQYPEHQLFEETVFEDISFVLRQQRILSIKEIDERVKSACQTVGLEFEEFRRRSPFGLSRGEMRRVALAGVLVQDPRLLILDEPTVGLDGPGKREILKEIAGLRHAGKTVVMISHSVEDLVNLVDRLIVLEEGKVLTSGFPAEVFSFLLRSGRLTFLVPSTFRLFHDLRSHGGDLPDPIYQVEKALPLIDRFLRKGLMKSSGIN